MNVHFEKTKIDDDVNVFAKDTEIAGKVKAVDCK